MELKETAVYLMPKEQLAFTDNDAGLLDYLVKHLSSELGERLMGILDREDEIVVRMSELIVRDYIPTNSVEYRREIKWDELVRCRDCRYWYTDTSANIGYCSEFMTADQDGFCKWAERREDE